MRVNEPAADARSVVLAEPCSPAKIKGAYGPNGRRAALIHTTNSGQSGSATFT